MKKSTEIIAGGGNFIIAGRSTLQTVARRAKYGLHQ
jgi:hypothetical protein